MTVPGARGRMLLEARRVNARMKLKPIGPPPARLTPKHLQVWHEVKAVAPVPLTNLDSLWLEMAVIQVTRWRDHGGDREALLLAYRWLGQGLIHMRDRRRLLFPDKPPVDVA